MKNILSASLLSLILVSILYSIPNDVIPAWMMSYPARILVFICLTALLLPVFKYLLNFQNLPKRPKRGSVDQRKALAGDIVQAFTERSRQTGDNLIEAAAILSKRGLGDLAEGARKTRDKLLAIGEELKLQNAESLGAFSGINVNSNRMGEIVMYDKSLLALVEETTENSVEFTRICRSDDAREIENQVNHYEETLLRMKMLVQDRREKIRGIRS